MALGCRRLTGLLAFTGVIAALVAGVGMHHGHLLSDLGVEHDPAVGSQTSFRSIRSPHVNC